MVGSVDILRSLMQLAILALHDFMCDFLGLYKCSFKPGSFLEFQIGDPIDNINQAA